jgi:hypothetical protein
MLEVEPSFWIVLVVQNPSVIKEGKGVQQVRWKEDDLDDVMLQSVVSQAYNMFKV